MKLFVKTFIVYTMAFYFLFFIGGAAANYTAPTFPSCPTPGAELKINYDYGSHQIVGEQGQRLGSDAVYRLGNNNFLQCFCPLEGSTGIQTAWLAAGNLSYEEKNNLIASGWIDAGSGVVWDLSDQDYLAKNTNFSCQAASNNMSTPTPTQLSPIPETRVGGSSSSNDNDTVCRSDKPSTPSLNIASQTGNSVTLSWTSSEHATDYSVYYGPQANKSIYSVPSTNKVTSYTISDLENKQEYCFVVRAKNNCAQGENSNEVCTTTNTILGASSLPFTGKTDTTPYVVGIGISGLLLTSYGLRKKKA